MVDGWKAPWSWMVFMATLLLCLWLPLGTSFTPQQPQSGHAIISSNRPITPTISLTQLYPRRLSSKCVAASRDSTPSYGWRRSRRATTRATSIPSSSTQLQAVGKTGSTMIESAEHYDRILDASRERPLLIFWTAPWCGPCRLSIPVVKEVMKQYIGQIDVVEICTDDLPEVASDAGVLSIPTIHLLYRGELMDTIIGCVAKGVLASAVEKVLEDTVLNNKSK